MNGRLCPLIENAPQIPAEMAVAEIAIDPGIWMRAGMEARVLGLSISEAVSRVPFALASGRTRDDLVSLFRRYETGALIGMAKAPAADGGENEER